MHADCADVCFANGSALLVHRNRLHRIAFNLFIISPFPTGHGGERLPGDDQGKPIIL